MTIGNIAYSFKYGTRQFCSRVTVSKALSLLGIIFFTFAPNRAQAQFRQPSSTEGTSTTSDRISPNRPNYVSPIQRRNFYPNSGGSQKFFRQDNNDLYFLPANQSEPILQLEENVETEATEGELPREEEGLPRELPTN